MTQIKKITDKQGNDIYLRTHTKAVVDDNGYTVESRLQAMQDEINAKQLEVGAVPSDLTPTEGSSNWVTSGGVFEQISYQNILFKNTSTTIWNSGNIQNGSITTAYSNRYVKLAIPSGVETLHYNRIVVNSTFSNSFYVSNNTSSGYTRIYLNQNNTLNVSGFSYLIILLFDKPTLAQAQAENITVYTINKLSSSRTIEAINNLDYILENNIFELSNATVGQTDTSIMTCTIDGDIIKFVATGRKTALKYGYINLPLGTLNYERYKIIFDYEAVIGSNSDGYFTIANTTGSRGVITGTNLKTGKSSASFTFDLVGSPVCLKMESNALGDSGCYVYIKNLRIVPYNGESYRTIPQLDSIIQDIVDSQNIIPNTVSPVPYGGNKILSINSGNVIGIKKLMTCKAGQAGASYGDYYFQFADNHAQLNIYNLSSAVLHSSVTMTSDSNDHCNTACFSNIFYDTNDTFPLIYTSGSRTATYNHIQVWRIQLENDVFSISKVQEITLPTGTTSEWRWGQAYLDNELGYLWYATNGRNATYYKFNIPAIFSDGVVVEDVTLTESDIIDSFITEKNRSQQGGVIKNGTLYLFDGVPACGTSTRLYVVDIWGKRLVNVIDIQNLFNLTVEFEGCGIYNDTLIASASTNIYAIYF